MAWWKMGKIGNLLYKKIMTQNKSSLNRPLATLLLTQTETKASHDWYHAKYIWVRSWNFGCLVTWFCYQLIAKPGNKTAAFLWPGPYHQNHSINFVQESQKIGHLVVSLSWWVDLIVMTLYEIRDNSGQCLTHGGWDKIAAIFQTTFLNGFPWMKMYQFRLRFTWNLFPRVQLATFQYWVR